MFSSIVIAGVGGQGTLLASKILSEAAQRRGLFVRTSETIGMAQRGGSVSSHIRIGSQDVSPVIPLRHADVLIGFELAEAARQLNRLKPDASAVVNVD
jgi:indolepyruvate ferredoxin oxidoreductase beta subunit